MDQAHALLFIAGAIMMGLGALGAAVFAREKAVAKAAGGTP